MAINLPTVVAESFTESSGRQSPLKRGPGRPMNSHDLGAGEPCGSCSATADTTPTVCPACRSCSITTPPQRPDAPLDEGQGRAEGIDGGDRGGAHT